MLKIDTPIPNRKNLHAFRVGTSTVEDVYRLKTFMDQYPGIKGKWQRPPGTHTWTDKERAACNTTYLWNVFFADVTLSELVLLQVALK